MPREFDIVLFGASESVGTILAAKFAASQAVNWAIAGRSTAVGSLSVASRGGKKPRLILANAVDEESMREMARRAMVLVTTGGPMQSTARPSFAPAWRRAHITSTSPAKPSG